MTQSRFKPLALVAALALLFLASCGGGDEPTTTADSAASTAETQQEQATTTAGSGEDASQDAGEDGDSAVKEPEPVPVDKIAVPPVPKGADDSIQTYGEEAGPEESAEIVGLVKAWVDAQMKGDWQRVCELLGPSIHATLDAMSERTGESADCATTFKRTQGPGSRRALRPLTKLQVGSVRIDEDSGFVIFKTSGDWYALSVVLDGEHWRIGSAAPVPLGPQG